MSNKNSISQGQQKQRPSTPLVEVAEVSATKGAWATPAASKVNLAISLSNFSARWHGTDGIQSQDVSVGTVAICPLNYSRLFVMQSEADFGIVSLSNEAFEQVEEELTPAKSELQSHDLLNDTTLKHLMNILLGERRADFRSGSFFLESVTFSLASYLSRHYSGASAARQTSAASLAPSTLRRCIQLIQDNLEGDLRLKDLAYEAKLSISHLIRGFRQSTGDTPYQFLLRQRIERAQSLMRDRRSSLTEVAMASGFADQHHLARVFRRITGVTPTSYRRSL